EQVVWWWLVFAGLIPGVMYTLKRRFRDLMFLYLFIGAFGLLYSMMFANVGIIVRQRAQLLPWLLIVATVGLEQRALRKQRLRELRAQRWIGNLDPPDGDDPDRTLIPGSRRFPPLRSSDPRQSFKPLEEN